MLTSTFVFVQDPVQLSYREMSGFDRICPVVIRQSLRFVHLSDLTISSVFCIDYHKFFLIEE